MPTIAKTATNGLNLNAQMKIVNYAKKDQKNQRRLHDS